MRLRVLVSVGILAAACLGLWGTRPQAWQQPGTFRARITVVPIDVRVIDRDGKPVTDLTRDDFIVLEDGVRQQIQHFALQTYAPEAPEKFVVDEKPMLRKVPKLELVPQTGRVFLLVLGRGRLNVPSKGMDGTIRFVREQLLPQDYVAVLAYNRATDFTREHEKVAQILERYKRRHESIEGKLSQRNSGLGAVYGDLGIPASLQGEIDEIFKGPGAVATRDVKSGAGGQNADAARQDQRRTTDALMRADALAGTDALSTSIDQLQADAYTDLPFEQYVSRNAETMQDLGNLQAGIEYLRYLEGEKHIVFLTERGLFFPRMENDRNLAALASDARVVIDTIQTGGIPAQLMNATSPAAPIPGPTMTERFAIMSMKNVSQMTGGQSSAFDYVDKALGRIDEATRVEYVLGYYPTNTNWNDRYRRIVVRVNRPGVTVLFRHGYYGSTVTVPVDHRAFMTYRRVAAAGNYDREVKDLPLKAKVTVIRNEAKIAQKVTVNVVVDPTKVVFKDVEGRHTAVIDLTFFCADEHERLIGELWQKMDLKLKDDTYQRMLKEGVPYTFTLDVRGEPRYVKAIAYNYEADLVGSVIVKLPRQ